ncbi:uncharacterized protein LOC126976163 [Leptidea sinapis]|uniref:uncharacterized protein LOC126976163 n=1 Tax=Leptidea sinapis TaxID=189913 RepID=UPI0021C39D88|nr:uncharacterized protein LOC126976163 [Leptidea sinapis]
MNMKSTTIQNYPYKLLMVTLKRIIRTRLDDIYPNSDCCSFKQAVADYRKKFPESSDNKLIKVAEQDEYFQLRRIAGKGKQPQQQLKYENNENHKSTQIPQNPYIKQRLHDNEEVQILEQNLSDEKDEDKGIDDILREVHDNDGDVLRPIDRIALNKEMSDIRNLLNDVDDKGDPQSLTRLSWMFFCDDFEESLCGTNQAICSFKLNAAQKKKYVDMEAIEAFLKQRFGIIVNIIEETGVWIFRCESFYVFNNLIKMGKNLIGNVWVSFIPLNFSLHENRSKYEQMQVMIRSPFCSQERVGVKPNVTNDDNLVKYEDVIVRNNKRAKKGNLPENDFNDRIDMPKVTVDMTDDVQDEIKTNADVTPVKNFNPAVLDNNNEDNKDINDDSNLHYTDKIDKSMDFQENSSNGNNQITSENNPKCDKYETETMNRSTKEVNHIEQMKHSVIHEDDLEDF